VGGGVGGGGGGGVGGGGGGGGGGAFEDESYDKRYRSLGDTLKESLKSVHHVKSFL